MAWMPEKTYKRNKGNWLKIKSHEKLYNSGAWRKLSKSYKMRYPTCCNCTRPTAYVDHIVPLSEGGAFLDESNLQPLCKRCNAIKTAKQK